MTTDIVTRADRAEITTDDRIAARVVESMVLRGDISALTAEERAKFYVQMCGALGISAASQPLAVLRLNGKEVLYVTRGATDQLAAIHRLNRRIVDGPRVIDLAGTKLVLAVCEATHPNGRVETATATVPLTDHVNVLMKCETKAKRRATLSILGLGMLDETEIETIPARDQQPGRTPTREEIENAEREPAKIDREIAEAMAEHKYQGGPSTPQAPAAEGRDPRTAPSFVALLDALEAARSTDDVVAAWLAHGARLAQDGSDVLEVGRADTFAAWTANGGTPNGDDLRAAIEKARAAKHAAEADTKPRTKSRKSAAAPLASAIDHVDMPAWAAHIEATNSKWAIATGFHKRSDIWRAEGTIARARGITIDRLCAVMCTDDLDATKFLDGNEPVRRNERRSAMTERRPTR